MKNPLNPPSAMKALLAHQKKAIADEREMLIRQQSEIAKSLERNESKKLEIEQISLQFDLEQNEESDPRASEFRKGGEKYKK